jgi:hypothetical protein
MEAQTYVIFYALIAVPFLMMWPYVKQMLQIMFTMASGITGAPWL